MDTELVRPLTSNVIHIRSKDATELTSGYNSHFRVDLTNPIIIEKGYEGHIIVSSAEIPYSFYNVSADVNNNTIIYNDGTEKTYTIPSKNYDINELISTLTNDTNFPFTATFDRPTMKITLENTSGGSITINWSNSGTTAEKLLGFSGTADDVVANGATTTSDFVVNLCSVHSIFVKSNIATGNVQSTRAGNSSTLQKISVDVNGFNMIYLNQDDFRTSTITQTPVIDFIEFRITDQNDNLIQFNNVNFELSFIINTYKIYVENNENNENYIGINRRRQLRTGSETTPVRTPNQTIQTPADRMPNVDRLTNLVPQPPQNNIDATHPVENKSEIEAKAEYTILDNLLENMK
tara:strand:+ start:9831 stop:10880 length:1050 start_codon:yes stop_codon:yes gene_type:complete